MDILFYLILAGVISAAGIRTESYDYSFDSSMEETAPAEDYGSFDDPASAEDDGSFEEPEAPEPPDFSAVAPPFQPAQPGAGIAMPPQAAGGFEAEDQTATGRMTTAAEVRPILTVTKGSWIAVREWEGQDLLYFTNLLAWRCGLHEIRYSVNGGAETVLEAEPCYVEEGAPNALKVADIQPYVVLPLGSVQSVTVSVLYDDLSTDSAQYTRQQVQIN